jgi:hypothetical protein
MPVNVFVIDAQWKMVSSSTARDSSSLAEPTELLNTKETGDRRLRS